MAALHCPTFSVTLVKLSFSMADYKVTIQLEHIGQVPNCLFPVGLSILLLYYKVTVLQLNSCSEYPVKSE